MKHIKYVLGLIAALAGAVIYLFVKKQSAEALLQNNEVKSKINDLDKDKSKNDGLLAAEAEKRADAAKDADARKNADIKPGDFN